MMESWLPKVPRRLVHFVEKSASPEELPVDEALVGGANTENVGQNLSESMSSVHDGRLLMPRSKSAKMTKASASASAVVMAASTVSRPLNVEHRPKAAKSIEKMKPTDIRGLIFLV
uniref:Uncharacterized protein n=1 Tax=Glossina austeni TaxID=7395 RepID=A0A1A9UTU1_GLOAU